MTRSVLFAAVLAVAAGSASAQTVTDPQIAAIVVTANQVDIDAGKLAGSNEVFNLGEVIEAVVAPHRLAANKKKVRLTLQLAPEIDGPVQGDPAALRQILANLLSNAVKFTDRGEGRVTVSRPNAAEPLMRIEVADTGIGFDASLKARIF